MKTIKYLYLGVLSITAICFNSCQNLDDYDPLFSLPAEEAIADEASAEKALTGIYAGFLTEFNGGNPEIHIVSSLLSGLAAPSFFTAGIEENGFANNTPVAVETIVTRGGYTRMYAIVNRCNWLLQEITDLRDSDFETPARRLEIIGEAKAVRATANFYLLRLWGQFYDVNSTYGINIRTTPAISNEAFPRNTVAESYTTIVEDLDDAITNAPDLRAKYFTNKTYAKALKAKVMLYQGNYVQAAALAQDVIDNSGADFALAATYDELFENTSDAIFDSSEHLFGSRGVKPNEDVGMGAQWGFYAEPLQAYIDMAETGTVTVDARTINYDGGRVASQILPFVVFKYAEFAPGAGENFEMIYHLRMAEVYLILAEAEARANNMVTANALAALNAVRTRAGATTTGGDGFETYPAAITLDQFLEAVRIEKMIELGAEMGEEWFDLVRYDFADGFGTGFQASDIKPSATNPDKFILPISAESIDASGGVVKQNPGY